MQIAPDQLEAWKKLKSYGDAKRIWDSDATISDKRDFKNVSTEVWKAFSTGKCPDDIYYAMLKFYTDKQNKHNELMNKTI